MPTKLKSSASIYALMVALVIGVGLSATILFSVSLNLNYKRLITAESLINNANSGIQLLLGGYHGDVPSGNEQVDLFGNGRDLVTLKWRQWGAYRLILSEAKSKLIKFSKGALLGAGFPETNSANLYLTDHKSALSLCGSTKIEGIAALPEAGLRRSFIDNQYYNGSELVYGSTVNSDDKLPTSFAHFFSENYGYLSGKTLESDSICEISDLKTDTVNWPFYKKTLVFKEKDTVILDRQNLTGNIIVLATSKIKIKASSCLKDIMVIAPQIEIESGFTGIVHLITSNHLLLGEGSRLLYPSSILYFDDGDHLELGNSINFMPKSLVYGSVLVLCKYPFIQKSLLSIHSNAEIIGLVHCESKMDIRGKVCGNLYVNKFVVKTASSYYENYLLNAAIGPFSKISLFGGAYTTEKKYPKIVIKWIL